MPETVSPPSHALAPGEAPREPRERDERVSTHGIPEQRRKQRLRSITGFAVVALLCTELVPVVAWLKLLASLNGPTTPPALPAWWMFVVLLLGWSIAALLRRQSGGTPASRQVLRVAIVAGWVITAAISLMLSPAAYAGVALTMIPTALAHDLTTSHERPFSAVLVVGLILYLWWRGVVLGRERVSRERGYLRMVWSMAATVGSLVVAGTAGGDALRVTAAELTILLCLTVFAGLIATALGYLVDTAYERPGQPGRRAAHAADGQVTDRAWIFSTIGISGVIVALALILGLLLSAQDLGGVREVLAPVVSAIGTVLYWIITGVAYVLFFFLGGIIQWLQNRHSTPRHAPPPQIPATHPAHGQQSYLPPEWVTVATWVVMVLAAIVVAWLLIRLVRRLGAQREDREFEEERQSLSIKGILGEQLNQLLDSIRARRQAARPAAPLPPRSVRALYQRFLTAAAQAGIERRRSETPDEFARRVAHTMRNAPQDGATGESEDVAQVVSTLTATYDTARYGPDADVTPDAPAGVREQVEALEERLKRSK